MNAEEALKLCRLAKAASPAQAVDDYTPQLWALALTEERFADAQQALLELAREQEWVHLSHIVKRVKKIRTRRIEMFGTLPDPPPGIGVAEYPGWLADTTRRIADGEHVERPAIAAPSPDHKRRRDELLAGAFQEVPDA